MTSERPKCISGGTPRQVVEAPPRRCVGLPDGMVSGSSVAALSGSSEAVADQKPRSLEILTNTASAAPKTEARAMRFVLQAAARELLPKERVAWCLRRPRPGCQTIDVMHSPERQKAYYANLITCRQLWACPVCSSRITEARREMLVELMNGSEYKFALATMTLSHSREERCSDVLARFQKAHRRFKSGRWYQGFKSEYRILETCKALEITHGDKNGWHVHCHELLVGSDVWTPRRQMEMLGLAKAKWARVVSAFGGFASLGHGLDISFDGGSPDDLASYLLKRQRQEGVDPFEQAMAAAAEGYREPRWGHASELTKAGVKSAKNGNRSMLDLLRAYALKGDLRAGLLWVAAVDALHGHKQLVPSRGFWKLLGRGRVPLDDDLAEIVVGPLDRLLAALPLVAWRSILKQRKRAEVLAVADGGDRSALLSYLAGIGIDVEGVSDV